MANIERSNRGLAPWRDFLNVDNFFESGLLNRWERNFPAVNISENEKSYTVDVVAPGFAKEDFKIKVDNDMLTISAESKYDTKENGKDKEYTRREYSYNSFTRSFRLPEDVKDDSINATYRDGVLGVELPKSKVQVKATKEIAIK